MISSQFERLAPIFDKSIIFGFQILRNLLNFIATVKLDYFPIQFVAVPLLHACMSEPRQVCDFVTGEKEVQEERQVTLLNLFLFNH